MPAYLAARMNVKNPERLTEYSKSAAPIIAQHGGRLLFKGGADDNLVGEMSMPNLAVFEFPDKASIDTFFNSDEYQALTALRNQGADMVLSAHEAV